MIRNRLHIYVEKLKASRSARRRSRSRRLEAIEGLENRCVLTASTLSVATATAVYGGTANLSATLTSASLPLANEVVDFHLGTTDVGTSITNAQGVAAIPSVSIGSLAAGSYAGDVTASFAGDSTHNAATASHGLTVTKAILTVTPNHVVKPYGVSVPALTATYSGFVNGDTIASLTSPVTLSTTATTTSTFGNYTISSSGGAAANYTISHGHGSLSVPSDPTNTAFITSLYQGLLGRNAGVSGSDINLARLNNGATKLAVITQIYDSPEAVAYRTAQGLPTYAKGPQQIALITGLYQATIDRNAEPQGLNFWLAELNSGMNEQQVAAGIAASPEAVTDRAAGVPLPTQDQAIFLVTSLYQNILHRNPEAQGLEYWSDKLTAGESAAQLTSDIYTSLEATNDRARNA